MRSIDKTITALLKQYGFYTSNYRYISNNVDSVFRIVVNNNSYLLKIYSSSYDVSVFGKNLNSYCSLNAEMDYLQHLYYYFKSENITIQMPIKTINNRYVSEECGTLATLTTWIDGDIVAYVNLTKNDFIELGRIIGLIHNFNKNSKIEFNTERSRFDTSRLQDFMKNIVLGNKKSIYSDKILTQSQTWVNELHLLLDDTNINEFGIIHGDYYSYNIIKTNENCFIPIDFGLCTYGFYYQDLASICNEITNVEYEKAFIESYEKTTNVKVHPEKLIALQKYLTLFFLSANRNVSGDYDWVLCSK